MIQMKKVLFILIAACFLITGCSKTSNVFNDSSKPAESSQESSQESKVESSVESESSVEESSVEESSVEESSVEESSVEESSVVDESSAAEESESSAEEPAPEEPAAADFDMADQKYHELQFKTPADWTREGGETDAQVIFRGETVMMQMSSADMTVQDLLSEDTKKGWVEGFGSAFETFNNESIEETTIDGRPAFRCVFSATASGQSFIGDGIIFQSDAKMYVFVIYSLSPEDGRESYVKYFDPIIASIKIGGGSEASASAETGDSWNTKYEAGEYVGGDSIPVGEYVFFRDPAYIAAVVMISTNGDFNDYENIVYSEIIDSAAIGSVNEGEYVQLNFCYAVPIEEVNELPLDIKSGWYKVGKNLPAGTYKLEPTVDENTSVYYYFIYKDNRKENLISYGDVSEGATIEVKDGEYLVLSCCHIVQ